LVTSVDWAPTSRLAVLLSGGANAHVAHHLFPGHHHRHLAMLSEIIAETAAEHGLRHRVTSFGGMVCGQWRHLVALSRP
jgi:linoleoyl-CoA desaturase